MGLLALGLCGISLPLAVVNPGVSEEKQRGEKEEKTSLEKI